MLKSEVMINIFWYYWFCLVWKVDPDLPSRYKAKVEYALLWLIAGVGVE